jgi:hypothetical protein
MWVRTSLESNKTGEDLLEALTSLMNIYWGHAACIAVEQRKFLVVCSSFPTLFTYSAALALSSMLLTVLAVTPSILSSAWHCRALRCITHMAPRSPTSAEAFQLLSMPSSFYALLCVDTDSTQNNKFLTRAIVSAVT